MNRYFLLLISFFILIHVTAKPRPRNVIFIIGDGMGLAQISAAMSECTSDNAFAQMPIIGLSKTSSADNYVTDSGAGATVFAIGKKTKNYSIGVDASGNAPEGLFEKCKAKGMKTGVVVTSSVTHATPAAFYAHVPSRKSEDDIALFLLKGNCDIAVGGGIKFFKRRPDGMDLLDSLHHLGYETIADSVQGYQYLPSSKYIQLLADNGMPPMSKGRGDYLRKASTAAWQVLSKNKQGFFLMIEGSQIDWGGHDTDYQYMKSELLDLNETILAALDFAKKDKNTLVVVTADHETGGLTLLENEANKQSFIPRYTYKKHTGIMVPVFAFGPGSELFSGMYENTEMHFKFKQLLGLH